VENWTRSGLVVRAGVGYAGQPARPIGLKRVRACALVRVSWKESPGRVIRMITAVGFDRVRHCAPLDLKMFYLKNEHV
jgi:hypothetical protein